MSEKVKDYYQMLEVSYSANIELLQKRYGLVTDDYYREKSYKKFLKGEIKKPAKGNFTKTADGLYCHHVDENKYLNLTNEAFLLNQKPPFEVNKKNRLVYCDLNEHTILHAKIAQETNDKFGSPGLVMFLIPQIYSWYILEQEPTKTWEKNCYKKAFLNKNEAQEFISKIKSISSKQVNRKIDEYQ